MIVDGCWTGEGYGRVYKVWKGERAFILKEISYESKEEQQAANKEERLIKMINIGCPYLVEFIESFEDCHDNISYKYFVMEFCEKGTLLNLINDMTGKPFVIPEEV
jgi:serine/threonine protein kinase